MKKILFAVIAAVAFLGAFALTNDFSAKAQGASAQYNWSGYYFGGSAGWASSSYDWNYIAPAPAGCCPEFSVSKNDAIYGLHAGAQYQWNNLVLGIEGGWNTFGNNSWASQTGCVSGGTQSCQVRGNTIYTAGAKVGWANGAWLFYGDGGYASQDFRSRLVNASGSIFDSTSNHGNNGWYAGAGIDYVIYRGPIDILLGLEYQHMDFSKATAISSADAGACSINCRSIGTTEDIVRLRLTFKTGG